MTIVPIPKNLNTIGAINNFAVTSWSVSHTAKPFRNKVSLKVFEKSCLAIKKGSLIVYLQITESII